MDQEELVRQHYNSRPKGDKVARNQSPIIHLKKLNNYIKSCLIARYIEPSRGACILDVCCGKGGDLPKWLKSNVGYVAGLDIADKSIKEYEMRLRERRDRSFDYELHVINCFKEVLK